MTCTWDIDILILILILTYYIYIILYIYIYIYIINIYIYTYTNRINTTSTNYNYYTLCFIIRTYTKYFITLINYNILFSLLYDKYMSIFIVLLYSFFYI